MTIWQLMSWKLTGSCDKSDGELNRLVKTIHADDFKVDERKDFNAHTQMKVMDEAEESGAEDVFKHDGWNGKQQQSQSIFLPARKTLVEMESHSP